MVKSEQFIDALVPSSLLSGPVVATISIALLVRHTSLGVGSL